jgi:hypothetical protein
MRNTGIVRALEKKIRSYDVVYRSIRREDPTAAKEVKEDVSVVLIS